MPASKEMISQMYLKIGGVQADEPLMSKVKEIVVDTGMYLPTMFTVQFYDTDLALMNDTKLDIGKEVEISGKSGELNAAKEILAKGEIISVEPDFNESDTTLTIRGYDKSHRLHQGKKNRVFKQVKDSDMIQKIAQTCGLQSDIDSTSVTHDHVFQENQTDMEFIRDLAQRNGYLAYFEGGKLHFKKAGSDLGAAGPLEFRGNLVRFQARLSGAGQVNSSEVHGWDIKKKEAIVGKKTSPTGVDTVNGKDGSKIAGTFSPSQGLFQSRVVKDASEAEALAQANLNAQNQKFFQADGACIGNPKVQAGKQVELKGIGTRFSGKYTVSRAIHRYNNQEYITDFEISGYRSNTLPQLLSGQNNREAYGVVVGIVTNNSDPDDLARVCVKYPDVDDKLEGFWARLSSPMAGPERGIEFIPEVNDEVLVAFEHNDFNRPYIIGSLWNGKDKPPEKNSKAIASGKVNKRIIKSRSGHIITLDDTDKSEKITIQDMAGQTVVIDSTNGSEKIQIKDKGENTITMDGAGKSVSIESAKDMTIKAKGKIQIEAQQDISVNGMNLKMESKANMDMKATGPLKMQGATASVQGQGTAEFKASGPVTIQGAIVKIN